MNQTFWNQKNVFLTGHTGFKGSWLSLWLQNLKANVTGYALAPDNAPNLFEAAHIAQGLTSLAQDIRDLEQLQAAMIKAKPEIVIHMAAQSLVRYSYQHPAQTYATNVMGTVNVLEAVRHTPSVRAVIIVTSDKCYENHEQPTHSYRETDAMGGYDPYSSSKGCAELVTAAYRRSFFGAGSKVAVASVRAGNVIGGGDWAEDRLIPDMVRALSKGNPAMIRNPLAIRPWQYVLEPLSGYLLLAEHLYEKGHDFAEAWNFGPNEKDTKPVEWIADHFIKLWGEGAHWQQDKGSHPHEAHYLKLDCSKAKTRLHWHPHVSLAQALENITAWHKAHKAGKNMREFSLQQIATHQEKLLP